MLLQIPFDFIFLVVKHLYLLGGVPSFLGHDLLVSFIEVVQVAHLINLIDGILPLIRYDLVEHFPVLLTTLLEHLQIRGQLLIKFSAML